MSETEKLQLKKPDGTDFISVNVFNDNSDKIDKAYKELKEIIPILKVKVYDDLTTDADGKFVLPDMTALNTVIISAVCGDAFAGGTEGGIVYLAPTSMGTVGIWCLCAIDSGTGQAIKNKSLGRIKVWYFEIDGGEV